LIENECERAGNPDGDCIRIAIVFTEEVSHEQVCAEEAFEKLYAGGGVG
jgi:hypothetical protein